VFRVISKRSFWLLDDGQHRYMRMPRTPEGRLDWEQMVSDSMLDATWHPMRLWWIEMYPPHTFTMALDNVPKDNYPLLVIDCGNGRWALAPNAEISM
jgi:hypothetical protein